MKDNKTPFAAQNSHGHQNNFTENYRQIKHAFTKRFANPDLLYYFMPTIQTPINIVTNSRIRSRSERKRLTAQLSDCPY